MSKPPSKTCWLC
jgi:transposase